MTDTTKKTYGLLAMAENELEAARSSLLSAIRAYTQSQTPENKTAMVEADRNLSEVRKSYEDARSALNVKVSEWMAQARQ